MKLHNIVNPTRRRHHRRLGRGAGSGRGKTAGRGTKGQKARSGFNLPTRFEGGQTALVQRLPKAGGFVSRSTQYPIVRIADINAHFTAGERLSPKTLFERGLVSFHADKVKLVGPGSLKHFLRFENVLITKELLTSLPHPPRRPQTRKPTKPRSRQKPVGKRPARQKTRRKTHA